jgi:hypothetical protein
MFGVGLASKKASHEIPKSVKPLAQGEGMVRLDRIPLDQQQILRSRLLAAGERDFRATAGCA